MTNKEIALEVYENENSELSFNAWLEVRVNEGRITLEQAVECGYVITISKTKSKFAQIEAVTKKENDFSTIIEKFSKEVPFKIISRLVSFLDKKDVGVVTKFNLHLSNGDLVGDVEGTNGNFRIWHVEKWNMYGKNYTQLKVSNW